VQGARDPATAARVDGDVLLRQLDVTDPDSIDRLAGDLDRVDVLVNNAAILYDTWNRAATVDLDVVRARPWRPTSTARGR
jgi:NAD(P)-dependent dehydrogenase (short-subunit alcohol dehydrogenase family)